MLPINQLSYWERQSYFEEIDFVVIGAGITGFNCALSLRKNHPNAKIVILERGYLPTGASSKNAGFACFGSATELIDDLKQMNEQEVWDTVQMRWEGLQKLRSVVGDKDLDFQKNGSWDLITNNELDIAEEVADKMTYLNKICYEITGEENVFSVDKKVCNTFGFSNVNYSFHNKLEGQIDTGSMIQKLHKVVVENGIQCLFGIEVQQLETTNSQVFLQTNVGEIKGEKVAICTNGFAKQFLSDQDVLPARAQVLITKPIKDLNWKGTFHYQKGYYYFRNIHNRLLLGGGRNLAKEEETTIAFNQTDKIQSALKNLLSSVILPDKSYEIDYAWSGIMGVGKTKKPIVELVNERVAVGVRLGGMGVAIGSLVGQKVAKLLD